MNAINLKVKVTDDYSRFWFDKTINRGVNAANSKGIEDSMLKYGYNALGFISVLKEKDSASDANLLVIDGQHRLSAAESVGLPVFYLEIDESVDGFIKDELDLVSEVKIGKFDMLKAVNYQSQKWNSDNHIHLLAVDNPEAKWLEKERKKTGYSYGFLNILLEECNIVTDTKVNVKNIKNGVVDLDLSNENKAAYAELKDIIKDFKSEFNEKIFIPSEGMLKALIELLGVEKFQLDKLMEAVDEMPEEFTKVTGRIENLRQLVDLHNKFVKPGKKRIFMDAHYRGLDHEKLFN